MFTIGYAMLQNLPVGNFVWEDLSQWRNKDGTPCIEKIQNLKVDSSRGFLFEVDLSYPESLHNLHNAYPFCPNHKKVNESQLSPYQKDQARKLNIRPGLSQKLIADLSDKKNYVLHYRNLQQALKFGLKVTNISRILSFNQEKWLVAFRCYSFISITLYLCLRLANFISFNTSMRQAATTKFEQDFWKLM